MKLPRWRFCAVFLLLCVGGSGANTDAGPAASATVVVFNERDAASVKLAGYYAGKRGIPFDHLLGVSCTREEWVSREEYEKAIAEPLRKAFLAHGWWKTEADIERGRVVESQIRFVALMRGIPLKIGPAPGYEGDRPLMTNSPLNHSEAALDSELAVLGLATRQISGAEANPFFKSDLRLDEAPVPWLLLVCRLDAAKPETVRRMIDDASAAETTGLLGFAYIDSRGIPAEIGMGEGDEWLRRAAADAAAGGVPCVLDTAPELFPEHYPMSRAALYLGWYAGQVEGVFKDENFRFVPGAVAVHLHSFSGDSLREPLRGWCAPLLERGAAATLGNVYEPYLSFTPHLDVFEQRLRVGWTFAEAAYASQPLLSWMTTFIGDPLYRPFKPQPPGTEPPEYAACRKGAWLWTAEGHAAGVAWLQEKAKELQSGIVWEELGLLEAAAGDSGAALEAWAAARQYYKEDADNIRCALHAVETLRREKKSGPALALVREEIARFPNAEATALLRAIELELNPLPSSTGRP